MDFCLVRIWDVRPFAPKERCVKILQGNVHNFEKVSAELGEMLLCYERQLRVNS